jgi:hypothetical protein
MGDDREPYEPLWAESLRREASPTPEAAANPKPPSFPTRPALAIAAVVAVAVLIGAIVSDDSSRVTFANLPSYWESVKMRCATVRIEEDDRTIEIFRCKARGAGQLPPGTYRSPAISWNSDFDRRRASDLTIRISPTGVVVGWALYKP